MRRMEQYFPVRWTNQSQIIRFEVSRENTRSNGGLFYLCLLALGLLDYSEVEINDVLGEGDNLGSLSTHAFETRTATGSELFSL